MRLGEEGTREAEAGKRRELCGVKGIGTTESQGRLSACFGYLSGLRELLGLFSA